MQNTLTNKSSEKEKKQTKAKWDMGNVGMELNMRE